MRSKMLAFGLTLTLILLCSVQPIARADDLITAPLDELLPSREDIPTEWFTGESGESILTELGFKEGKSVGYDRIYGEYSEMNLRFYVYRFSDVTNASAYYDKVVNQIKSGGGYTEVPIAGVFAVMYDMGTEEEGFSWGVIGNVLFGVNIYNDYLLEDPTDELVTFTKLEMRIVPESQSLLVLPLFIATALMAIIVHRRRESRLGV